MAAPPNFHCYFGHSSSYFPGARQPPGAAGEAARRGDTQRRAHGRGAGPTPARRGRRRGASSGGRRGAGETGRGRDGARGRRNLPAPLHCVAAAAAAAEQPPVSEANLPRRRRCRRGGEGAGGEGSCANTIASRASAALRRRPAELQPPRGAGRGAAPPVHAPAPPPSAARPERTGQLLPPWPLPSPALGRLAAARRLTAPPPRTPVPRRGPLPFVARTFRAAGSAPPAAAAGQEVAPPRPRRFPPSRCPGRPSPPAPEPPRPATVAMAEERGDTRGCRRGSGTRTRRCRGRASRHHAGVGASPARCCGRCGGSDSGGPRRSCCPEGGGVARSPAVTCLAAKLELPADELELGQKPCARPQRLSPASPNRLRLPAGHRLCPLHPSKRPSLP